MAFLKFCEKVKSVSSKPVSSKPSQMDKNCICSAPKFGNDVHISSLEVSFKATSKTMKQP